MKKKLIAAILTGAMLVAGMSTGVWADGVKSHSCMEQPDTVKKWEMPD